MTSKPTAKPTALFSVHEAAGAHFTDFAGWQMPLRYDSELAEHHAVRRTAGLFDLSHMGEIEIAGDQAAAFLDHALVSTLSTLAPSQAKYTMICREDGGILDDLIVYRLADHRFLVVANAANTAVVLAALRDRTAGFDVEVQDRGDDWSLIAVQGPASPGILQEADLTGVDLQALRYYSIAEATLAGRPVRLARTGYTGEDGFEIFCAPDHAVPLWQAITASGTDAGLVPAGLACRDTLRLEAGMPLYGNELTADLTPYQAGLGRVVALDKPGDFIGRTALERQSGVAPIRRRIGLRSDGRRAPRAGYTVLHPDTGQEIGKITSGALSPTLGHPIAMAYLDLAHAEPDHRVHVDVRGTPLDATTLALPFYRRPRPTT